MTYNTSSTSKSPPVRRKISEMEFNSLRTLLEKNGIEWMDNRSKGGNFWVLMPDRKAKPTLASVLDLYRFEFKEGKGFWFKEDE